MRCSSEPNTSAAKARANSVFPTPVGPRKRKIPAGRLRGFKPARATCMACATRLTASSWPMTRLLRRASRLSKRSLSSRPGASTGMPVRCEITSAIKEGVIIGCSANSSSSSSKDSASSSARKTRACEHASSKTLQALSGRRRFGRYCTDRCTAACNVSLVIVT